MARSSRIASRVVQHRQRRDNRRAREIAELRKVQQQLERQIQQHVEQQKRLTPCVKCQNFGCENCEFPSPERLALDAAQKKRIAPSKKKGLDVSRCPKCNKDSLRKLALPRGTISACSNPTCKHRSFVKTSA